MEKKRTPCTLQPYRASRARKNPAEIIADFEHYTRYAAIAFIALFAVITLLEVTGW